MKKVITGVLVISTLILFLVVGFSVYAQFALDYSLENLKEALVVSREKTPSLLSSQAYSSRLEELVMDEASRKNADFQNVVLLEHAARSVRDAVENSAYARARVYLSEVLKERSSQRSWFFRTADSVYYIFKSFADAFKHFFSYLLKRFKPLQDNQPLTGTGVLILGEAERNEKNGKLTEARRYYQEFLSRYPDRPERGFVTIALAHVQTKLRHLDEAEKLLESVQKEFPGSREEAMANKLLVRIASIRNRLARLPEIEEWIKERPERIFEEEGGLELALNYIATFQTDRALSVLEKIQEAPDPRVRAKALFYRGLVYKWKGDLAKGKEIFESLAEEKNLVKELNDVTQAELADIHYENRDYDQAINRYSQFSQNSNLGLGVLSELEQGEIYLFRIGNTNEARQRLEKLKRDFPGLSPEVKLAGQRLEEALQRNLREDGFRALASGRIEAASGIFKNHLKRFPRDGQVHSALASIYVLRNSIELAVDEAEKGYGLHSDEYTASVLGYVYEKIGEFEKAEKYYTLGTKVKPSYFIAKFNLAVVKILMKRYTEADQLLQELEKRTPEPPLAVRAKILNNRGCALWGLGKGEEAKNQFQEAFKIYPGFPEANRNLKLPMSQKPTETLTETPILR